MTTIIYITIDSCILRGTCHSIWCTYSTCIYKIQKTLNRKFILFYCILQLYTCNFNKYSKQKKEKIESNLCLHLICMKKNYINSYQKILPVTLTCNYTCILDGFIILFLYILDPVFSTFHLIKCVSISLKNR